MTDVVKVLLVLATALAVSWGRPSLSAEPADEKDNAFDRFIKEEITKLRAFDRALGKEQIGQKERNDKVKAYAEEMVPRFEAFAESEEGKPFALNVKREIIAIAVGLANDDNLVNRVLAEAEDFQQACELKFLAISLYHGAKPDRAKSLLDELLQATKDKDPKLYKQAKQLQFQVAPEGLVFPEFPKGTKDTEGKPIKIADYRGKVVRVEFWAAWCGPCMFEAPNVVRAYRKYHPKGFEIIGISLDVSKEQMEQAMEKHGMTWRQYFDGLKWDNRVANAYGVNRTPTTYLVGKDGKIVASNLQGRALEMKLADLLGGTPDEKTE